jgi:pseudaminic acid cytidylyltransferase
MRAICVIPARAGSKRVPRKNIRPFHGVPMLHRAIDAAARSGVFTEIIVSTEDEEVAAIARAGGAAVPFVRPAELADDFTGTTPIIAHAVRALDALGPAPALVCCLYATTPLLAPGDLARGRAALLQGGDLDFAFSATTFPFPIQRAVRRLPAGGVEPMFPEHIRSRSQDLEEAWHDAGQFYWGWAAAWAAQRPLFSARSVVVPIPRHRVQDIDTPEDWARAEALYTALQGAPESA